MTNFIEFLGFTGADPRETGREGDDAGLSVRTTDEHANRSGTVHGGLIATLIDAVMADAVRAGLEDGESCATVSLTITYLSPGEIGADLVASAEVRKRGGSLVLVEADVSSGETAIAHGVATYAITTDS